MANKIYHEQHKCIGCSACASIAPQYWEMKETEGEYKAHIVGSIVSKDNIGTVEKKNIKEEEVSINKESAEACPVDCIHIIADNKVVNENSKITQEELKKVLED